VHDVCRVEFEGEIYQITTLAPKPNTTFPY
jgi:hypothetical protein